MASYIANVSWSIFAGHDHISSGNKYMWLESGWCESCFDI